MFMMTTEEFQVQFTHMRMLDDELRDANDTTKASPRRTLAIVEMRNGTVIISPITQPFPKQLTDYTVSF